MKEKLVITTYILTQFKIVTYFFKEMYSWLGFPL
jgi:hypothetical protein